MLVLQLLLQLALLISPAFSAKQTDKTALNVTVDKSIQIKTHSIYAPYIDQDLQNRWWDFGADAYINTNKHIRLTRARPSQMGWLWSRLPITAQNFMIEIEFKISGEGGHLGGDGLAVWLTTTNAQPGPVFGSIDKFEGLGIFLDTYANSRHPYAFPRVMAMLGDGSTSYDVGNDGESNSIGACSANYRKATVPTKLQLTYVKDKYVEVKMQYKSWEDWTDCFKIEPISLPQSVHLGLSALTGDVFDDHDIISVATYAVIVSDAKTSERARKGSLLYPSNNEESGSWLSFFIKLFLFAGICVGMFYGYQTYYLKNPSFQFSQFGGRGRAPNLNNMFSSGKRF